MLMCFACSKEKNEEYKSNLEDVQKRFKDYEDIERFKLGLSSEEKKEDYEYFWGFIYNGWPFLEVCERKGINLAQIKKDGYEKLKDINYRADYSAFYDDLGFKIAGGSYIGHFWPFGYSDYLALKEYFRYPVFNTDGTENETIINFYKLMPDDPFEYFGRLRQNSYFYTFKSNKKTLPQTKIIEEGKIAYIKIDTFHMEGELGGQYYEIVEKFLNETKDCKHLIIDISKNGGGYTAYWEGLVGLTLEYNKELAFRRYGLYNKNKYTKLYMEKFLTYFQVSEVPIKHIANVENANTKINTKAFMNKLIIPAYYGKSNLDTRPVKNRKNWLLISKDTFSAADRFAAFCKACNWATVVGNNTSGGGADVDFYSPIALPKSGLLIRSDIVYGLNKEGYCNNEVGTFPDIYTEKGKTALETCLDAIKKYDENNPE